MGFLADLRTYRMAINQRWNVKPEWRDNLMAQLVMRAQNPNISTRELNAITKTILAAEKQNQDDEFHADAGYLDAKIFSIASEIGLSPPPDKIADAGTGIDRTGVGETSEGNRSADDDRPDDRPENGVA